MATPPSRFSHVVIGFGPGVLLSVAAIAAAFFISRLPAFQRISAVVSDEISRLGVPPSGPITLVRIDRSFSKPDLERLLSQAIPSLVDNYRAAALGVDIDFRGYDELASNFAGWGAGHPQAAKRVVWAVGYERGDERAAQPAEGPAPGEFEACQSCSDANCASRFRPRPVFGTAQDPANYGLVFAWTDASGVSRASFRFGCHEDTTAPLVTFHFKLIQTYCDANGESQPCSSLRPHRQNVTKLFSWYPAPSLDLCSLVQCATGPNLGAPLPQSSNASANALANKIVILYSDLEGNDEHATIMGTRKGAEVVASLAMNEMLYGESEKWKVEALKWTTELLLAAGLLFLFHWRPTEHFAVPISGLLLLVYFLVAPWLSGKIPDFRNDVLALMLAFGIEVWGKASYQGLEAFIRGRRKITDAKTPSETVRI